MAQAIRGLLKKEYTPGELARACVKAVEDDNRRPDKLNAIIGLHPEKAESLAAGLREGAPLAGAPILVKDNMNVEGLPVACASKILEGYVSPYTGGAVSRLIQNGGLPFARANMDEFAMGSSTETSHYGIARNPVNRAYTPGGSSGGSAAAVAGGQAIAALGSDTGGSIRQPAACCGIVGLKPTYGRVSRHGLIAFGSSLDQIGPITNTVEDAAILLGAIAGYDPNDSTSVDAPVPDYRAALEASPKGKRIGLPAEYFSEGVEPVVRAAVERVVAFYRAQGCEMVPLSLPATKYAIGTYYVVATAEASANLARFDGVRYGRRSPGAKDLRELYFNSRSEGFGLEVKRRILLGTYVLSSGYYDAYYLQAMKVRRALKNDFDAAFAKVDLVLTPIMPEPVFKIGARSQDPIKMYLSDIFTVVANLVGVPAISVPCGKDADGLPIGFQLIGRSFDEAGVLAAAHAWDREQPR
ncbi:MAG: Asp-tRNA(Asn)/Glu-tRNA(Gln) amidotransferase subunit GatA [Spirochaetes bacterium]|nr:Asp-tRNA(Asn)/Glu-tRNA(Gln) amidotransferase subunit GatA [Spirochaetota bacterium]